MITPEQRARYAEVRQAYRLRFPGQDVPEHPTASTPNGVSMEIQHLVAALNGGGKLVIREESEPWVTRRFTDEGAPRRDDEGHEGRGGKDYAWIHKARKHGWSPPTRRGQRP